MPLTINRSLSWVKLAFADWSNTGTHYQVSYFSDVALPELHSNSVTAEICTSNVNPMSMLSLRKAVLLNNVLVLIPLLPLQWHLRTCLKLGHMNTLASSIQTTDWRNKLINCACSRRDTLWHGIETPAQQNCRHRL